MFDDDFIDECFRKTSNYYEENGDDEEYNGWAMGKVYDSNTFPQSLMGTRVRTPGRYERTNYHTARPTGQMLQNTEEYIHASVRARMDLAGRGVEPKEWYQRVARWVWCTLTFQKPHSTYTPQKAPRGRGFIMRSGPLYGWELLDGHASHAKPNMEIDLTPGRIDQVHWEYTRKGRASVRVMREDIFAPNGYEERLLLHDQKIANRIIFSNNKWQWFKKPKKERRWSKTF
jgi:hypothetical protein